MHKLKHALQYAVKDALSGGVKNAYMGTVGDRIAARMAELGEEKVDVNDVARAAGISRQAVYQWISGDTKKIRSENLVPVAELLGVREKWLIRGVGPKERDTANVAPEEYGVPVVGTAQLGTDGFWLEPGYPTGYGEGFILYPTKDKNAYALRVKGDSMRPRIRSGEYVIVLPNHSVPVGEEVFVKTKDGRCMVKKLGSRKGGSVELLSINDTDFKPFTLDEAEIEKIYYVAAIVKDDLYRSSM